MIQRDYTIEKAIKTSETSLESIVITDGDGIIVHCNNNWTRVCGYAKNEVVGKKNNILQGVLTEPYIINEINNAVSIKQITTEVVVTNYKKSGITFKNHLTILRLIGGFAAIVRDMGLCDYTLSYNQNTNALLNN